MPKISVVSLMSRPGGFCTLVPSLKRQTFKDFEWIVVDELHRWRAPVIADALARLPFPVKHLPTRESLWPVASTMRAGNTALAVAEGELVVHMADHVVAPAEWLEDHWRLHTEKGGKALGATPYTMRQIDKKHWHPVFRAEEGGISVWEMVDLLANKEYRGIHWSMIPYIDRDADGCPDLKKVGILPLDPNAMAPTTWMRAGQKVNEWFIHFRCDSYPLEAAKAVNGWDEEIDGGYIYGDTAMTIRLASVGVYPYITRIPVEVIDAHAPVKRARQFAFRDYTLVDYLEALTVQARDITRVGPLRIDFGIEKTDAAREKEKRLFKGIGLGIILEGTVQFEPKNSPLSTHATRFARIAPWVPGGKVEMIAHPDDTLAWKYVRPSRNILYVNFEGYDAAKFVEVLGPDRAAAVKFEDLAKFADNQFDAVVVALRSKIDGESAITGAELNEVVSESLRVSDYVAVTGPAAEVEAASEYAKGFVGVTVHVHDPDDELPASGVFLVRAAVET